MTNPFSYTPELDNQIAPAVSRVLNQDVRSAQRITRGEYNHVYKVVTNKQSVIARVFRMDGWPEVEKPSWLEAKLSELNIPHAKLLYHSRGDEFFPYGFMITEYLEGQSGWEAIDSGKIDFSKFHEKLSHILARVHGIKADKYGSLTDKDEQRSSFVDWKLHKLEKSWKKSQSVTSYDTALFQEVKEKTITVLREMESKFTPVLMHGDASPDNCVIGDSGEVILVDWDSAQASIWVNDYSYIMYWGSHMSSLGLRTERAEKIFQSSGEITKNTDFSEGELKRIIQALHILQAVDLLPYYYFEQKNMEVYENTKVRLGELVK